ncbi:acetyltransferase [Ralstonia pickettii]|nr:acetyltransferase [Ralstonia pickettii]
MKKIIIFGNSDFSRLLKWHIDHDDTRKVVAFCAESNYIMNDFFEGLPLIDFEKIVYLYPPDEHEILIGIGYSKMNENRKRVFKSCKQKGYNIASFYHSTSLIESRDLGEGNIILEQALISPFVRLGDGNIVMNNVSIAHDGNIGDFNTFSGMAGIAGNVTIKNNCFFGKSSVVSNDLTINSYSLIGAAAFVGQDVDSYSVVAAEKSTVLKGKKSTDFL